MMLSRRLLTASRFVRARPIVPRPTFSQIRSISNNSDIEDPDMNGGYVNPPPVKRQFRDPYADWWDKQERRNFGEPVHEDNDILGMFMIEQYTHFKPPKAFFLMGCFIATFLGLCGVVSLTYPDLPAVPRTWDDGLEKELGGPNALLAPKSDPES